MSINNYKKDLVDLAKQSFSETDKDTFKVLDRTKFFLFLIIFYMIQIKQ